jgi:hypothetical protein
MALAMGFAPAMADCINDAAAHHGVNEHVLRAIGWHESRLKPHAINRNRNGTVDIGAFQINTIHLPMLKSYGVDERALRDGCIAAYVGAWHLKRQMVRLGDTWDAVGAYHSDTPPRRRWYANQIASVLMQWGVMPRGSLPFTGVPLLAANQPNPTVVARADSPRPLEVQASASIFDSTN